MKTKIIKLFCLLILTTFIISANLYGQNQHDMQAELKSLSQKMSELFKAGRYEEAIPYAKKIVDIQEKISGKDNLPTAKTINNLALLYAFAGRYAEAETSFFKGLAIQEKILGIDHPEAVATLKQIADLYYKTGKYQDAEKLNLRILNGYEKNFGKENLYYAETLNNLAAIYRSTGRYNDAERLRIDVIKIFEKILGKNHPTVATAVDNLGVLYGNMGRYADAEPLHKRALEIYEKAYGKNHIDVAIALNNLAGLYKTTGRFNEAEQVFKRGLNIYEKLYGSQHPGIATILDNLAGLYLESRRYNEAEQMRKRALSIYLRAFGEYHPDYAITLNNLALLYEITGKLNEAEDMLKKTLSLDEKIYGKEHPGTAVTLHNLAYLYLKQNRFADAEPLYKRSLEIKERTLGKEHPDVATTLFNLAELYAAADNHKESHKLFVRAISIDEKKRENVFLLLSEKQKLSYMEQHLAYIEMFIIHASRYMQTDSSAIIDTFNSWLKQKGAVMEAQGRYLDAVTYSDDPEIKRKFQELNGIRLEIARLQISKPEKITFEEYRIKLDLLEKKKDALEAELSRLSSKYAIEKMAGKIDVKRISAILPENSVYLDFGRIYTFDFKSRRWGAARYLVFVLLPGKSPAVKLIELPDTAAIDSHISRYLKEMNKAKEQGILPDLNLLGKEAKAVYNMVIMPLEPYLKNKKQLFISPDGNLNLIPFEILVTSEGKYLMEKYIINYLAAGRDIVRFTDKTLAKNEALIIADPDYDLGLKEKLKVAEEMKVFRNIRGSISRDAALLKFIRLPDTKKEADAIEKLLKTRYKLAVKNYQNKKALEEVLFSVSSPKVLHLATHGFFLKEEEAELITSNEFSRQGFNKIPEAKIENPMLRSGIVFAGVNASLKAGTDDGMVNGEKILGLNLKGTDLVVLSACETGVGDIKNGEGVFGLKRAFILSGAKTVVMSLWSVPSKETTELMTEFYTLMSEGKSKAEALNQAKFNMMKKRKNPFFWGAFIIVGNPD